MKPRILISGCKESRSNYEKAVLLAGGEPCSYYLPPMDGSYDGLLLCGGGDLDPTLYGQKNTACTGIDSQRDAIELALTGQYLRDKKPVLGICRGLQVLCVALGGALTQDLGGKLNLFHKAGCDGNDRTHPVRSIPASTVHKLYGDVFFVNSAHHQAVTQPGDSMFVSAVSECGLIEAAEHRTLPVIGVQWHPERMLGQPADGMALFDWFIKAASS